MKVAVGHCREDRFLSHAKFCFDRDIFGLRSFIRSVLPHLGFFSICVKHHSVDVMKHAIAFMEDMDGNLKFVPVELSAIERNGGYIGECSLGCTPYYKETPIVANCPRKPLLVIL